MAKDAIDAYVLLPPWRISTVGVLQTIARDPILYYTSGGCKPITLSYPTVEIVALHERVGEGLGTYHIVQMLYVFGCRDPMRENRDDTGPRC